MLMSLVRHHNCFFLIIVTVLNYDSWQSLRVYDSDISYLMRAQDLVIRCPYSAGLQQLLMV